jgi:hypothetical protein
MDSPEGKGITRRAWDAYANAVNKVTRPCVEPFARKAAVPVAMDLAGFWLLWHVEGGFEGLRRRAKVGQKFSARDRSPEAERPRLQGLSSSGGRI